MNSPVLETPTPRKPLIHGALLAQENEAKKEQALFYLSLTFIWAELNYTPIEKMYLASLYAIKN